ncbi:MAG: GTP-binding protein, partial [Hyphomicrobiaceae bacterium]
KDHVPETEEYGIRSFVYRARGPFEPAKLHAFFDRSWPGVVRAKGFFWLATRPQFVGEVSQAGSLVRHEAMGYWWAAVPKKNWPKDSFLVERIEKGWHRLWGDRRQEIVFIGTSEMDEGRIRAELDDCLLLLPKEGKVDANDWRHLPDPFPVWRRDKA